MGEQRKNAYLTTLRQVATEACNAAHAAGVGGPVNWADLRCIGAQYWLDDEGDTGYRVTLSEADAAAAALHVFVRDFLAKRGFAGVEVVTEW